MGSELQKLIKLFSVKTLYIKLLTVANLIVYHTVSEVKNIESQLYFPKILFTKSFWDK
jgi:hypothetical protein